MWSQVGLRKHHYEQSQWRWWTSSWAISNPKRWCCESAALNMPANFENSTVATGLEKVSFHSNPKERQCQRMLKLLHNCTHLTGFKIDAQSSESETSTVCEMRTSRCSSWIYKRQRNQRSNCLHALDHRKSKRILEKHLLLLQWLYQSLWLCGSQQILENSERDGNTRPPDLPPEKSVCRSRSNS